MNSSELTLNIRDIIKSIPEDKYIEFVKEVADQMALQKDEEVALLKSSIDHIRSS
jgi:hypothetical protein